MSPVIESLVMMLLTYIAASVTPEQNRVGKVFFILSSMIWAFNLVVGVTMELAK